MNESFIHSFFHSFAHSLKHSTSYPDLSDVHIARGLLLRNFNFLEIEVIKILHQASTQSKQYRKQIYRYFHGGLVVLVRFLPGNFSNTTKTGIGD